MVINKRLFRTVKRNWIYFISSILLTMLGTLFFISCTSAGNALTKAVDSFLERNQVEDAEFTTYVTLDDDIEKLEEEYQITLEKMGYYDSEQDGATLRVMRESEKINCYEVLDGSDISSDTDMLITPAFAKARGLEIGSTYELDGQEFSICGYFSRPDYLYMLKNTSDPYINNEKFGCAVITQEAFEQLSVTPFYYYSVRYTKGNSVDFRKGLNENYQLLKYTARDKNSRISTAESQGSAVTAMATTYGPLIYIITIGFLIVILSRLMKQERKLVGILMSFGYRKKEIIGFYVKFGMVISVTGGILGTIFGMLFTKPMIQFYAGDYNLPKVASSFEVSSIAGGLLIPFALLSLTAWFYMMRALKMSAVSLLRSQDGKKAKKKKRIFHLKKCSNATAYGIRLVSRNKVRYLVLWFGSFLAAALILMGFITGTTITHVIDNEEVLSAYEYLYNYKTLQSGEYAGDGERMTVKSLELQETEQSLSIIGMEPDTEYMDLKNLDGKSVDLNDGFYITYAASLIYDIHAGDVVKLQDTVTLEEYSLEVTDIVAINKQRAAYCSLEHANEFLSYEDNSYNAVVSNTKQDISDELTSSVVKAADTLENFKQLVEPMMMVVYIIVVIGVLMGLIVIFAITSMIVDESAVNISMLKVLGYRKKEIIKMVLSMNKYIVVISYVVAWAVMERVCQMMCIGNIESFDMYMEVYFPALYGIGIGILFLIIFIFTQRLAARKIDKVGVQNITSVTREE